MTIKITDKVNRMISDLDKVLRYKPKTLKTVNDETGQTIFWKPRSNTNTWTIYARAAETGQTNNPYINERLLQDNHYAYRFAINVKRERWPELEKVAEDKNFYLENSEPSMLQNYIIELEVTNWTKFEEAFIEYFKTTIEADTILELEDRIDAIDLFSDYVKNNKHVKPQLLKAIKTVLCKCAELIKNMPQDSYTSKKLVSQIIDLFVLNFDQTTKISDRVVIELVKCEIKDRSEEERDNFHCLDKADWRLSLNSFNWTGGVTSYLKKFKPNGWKELEDILFGNIEERYGLYIFYHIETEKLIPKEFEEMVFFSMAKYLKEMYQWGSRNSSSIQFVRRWNYRYEAEINRSITVDSLMEYITDVVKDRCKGFESFMLILEAESAFKKYLDILKTFVKEGKELSQF